MNENEHLDPEQEQKGEVFSAQGKAEADELRGTGDPSDLKRYVRPLRARRAIRSFDGTSSENTPDEPKDENSSLQPNEPTEDPPRDTQTQSEDDSFAAVKSMEADTPLEMPAEEEHTDEAPDETPEERIPASVGAFDWIKSILLSFALVIFVFTVLFRGSTVVGDSMNNTLHSGERIIISDFAYTPAIGDIVVVHTPTYKDGKEFLIKRVIALGGQSVRINFNTWQVWVDGQLLDEPYVLKQSGPMESESMQPDENGVFEFVVKDNYVFVMGDNRNNSADSRSNMIGLINEQYILGRVILRYLPFNVFGPVQ